jgi:hypothetical protein
VTTKFSIVGTAQSTTTTTYTDISALSTVIEVYNTGTYRFEAVILTQSSNDAGLSLGLTYTGTYSALYASAVSTDGNQTTVSSDWSTSGTLGTGVINNDTTPGHSLITGIITITGTGTFKFGFAKKTNGTATVRAGSFMTLMKLT